MFKREISKKEFNKVYPYLTYIGSNKKGGIKSYFFNSLSLLSYVIFNDNTIIEFKEDNSYILNKFKRSVV